MLHPGVQEEPKKGNLIVAQRARQVVNILMEFLCKKTLGQLNDLLEC